MKNEKYLITLVIPTYNSRNHIDPLLTSLKSIWNSDEIKILFIDDGSSDKTAEYIKSKTLKYLNVEINTQAKNMGIWYMRQKAAKLINTQWIWYSDSDDNLINTDKIPELIEILKKTKSNVIAFKFLDKDIDGKYSVPNKYKKMEKRDHLIDFSLNNTNNIPFEGFVWPKIIHVSILRSINWHNTYNEDTHFTGVLYSKGRFTFYNEFLSSYNVRYLSISRRPNYSKFVNESTLLFLDKMLNSNEKDSEIHIVVCILMLITRCHLLTKAENKKVIKLFLKFKNDKLLRWCFSQDIKHKIFFRLFKMRLYFLCIFLLKFKNRKK